jgi:parvulin-like peptidyl-prolyl isomerase
MKLTITIAIAVACMAGQSQTLDPNALIATVDGDRIVASEYFTRMAFLENVGTFINGKFVELPPAFICLQQLLNERFIMQVAREKGVAPTAGEIQAEFAAQRAEAPDAFNRRKELGMSDAQLQGLVALDLAQFKLLTMGVNITDEQVANNYNMNRMVYVKPATAKLRVIVVKTAADRLKVDDALKTKPFAEVARTLSTDITRLDGGNLPQVPIGNLPQNVLNEVSRCKAGEMSQWIESEGSFLKYLVEAKTESSPIPLDDKLKREIRRRMMMIAGQQKNGEQVQALMLAKRKSAKVDIPAPALKKLWELYANDAFKR